MIKIKELVKVTKMELGNMEPEDFILEKAVNKFIEENNIIDLIDIKTDKQIQEYSGFRQLYFLNSITIIYREVK